MSFIWYINIQVMSSFKTRSHVDIQVQSSVVLDIYMHTESMFMLVSMFHKIQHNPHTCTHHKSQLCVKVNHHYGE